MLRSLLDRLLLLLLVPTKEPTKEAPTLLRFLRRLAHLRLSHKRIGHISRLSNIVPRQSLRWGFSLEGVTPVVLMVEVGSRILIFQLVF